MVRRTVAGMAVGLLVVLAPTAAGSRSAPPAPGAVAADGTVTDGRWTVQHPSVGVYRIQASEVDVTRWDAVADVSILPVGDGGEEIRFATGGAGTDTAFSFSARR